MTERRETTEARRTNFILAFAIIATIGIWANIAYYTWFADTLGWKYPDNTFQYKQSARFSDFYDMVEINRQCDPYNTKTSSHSAVLAAYPPLAELFFHLFSRFNINYAEIGGDGAMKAMDAALWLYLGVPFVAFPLLALCWLQPARPWLTSFLLFTGFNLSYPMIFALDRGNLELYILISITLYAWLTNSESAMRRTISVASLGVAVAFKIYPILFCLILIKRRRWLEAAGVVTIAGLASLVSYLCFQGNLTENVSSHLAIVHKISTHATTNINWATRYSSSLFSLIYLLLKAILRYDYAADWFLQHFVLVLWIFMSVVAVLLLWRRLSFARLFAAVCCLAILVTPESPDYKLLLLFPAIVAVINEECGDRLFNLLFVILSGLLLVAKNWIMIFDEVSYGSVFNPILVVGLLLLLLCAPAPSSSADNGDQSLVNAARSPAA